MHNTVIWDVTPFNLIEIYRSFEGAFWYRLQDCKIGYKNIGGRKLAYSSSLNVKAVCFSEMTTNRYQNTRCHIPEDSHAWCINNSRLLKSNYVKKRFRHGAKHKCMEAWFAFLARYVRNSTTIWPLEMLSLLAMKIFNFHLSLHLEFGVTLSDLRHWMNMTGKGNAIIYTCSKG